MESTEDGRRMRCEERFARQSSLSGKIDTGKSPIGTVTKNAMHTSVCQPTYLLLGREPSPAQAPSVKRMSCYRTLNQAHENFSKSNIILQNPRQHNLVVPPREVFGQPLLQMRSRHKIFRF